MGSLGPGRRKGRIPKIKAVRKTSGLLRALASARGSVCRRLQWAWVELVRLVWKHTWWGHRRAL